MGVLVVIVFWRQVCVGGFSSLRGVCLWAIWSVVIPDNSQTTSRNIFSPCLYPGNLSSIYLGKGGTTYFHGGLFGRRAKARQGRFYITLSHTRTELVVFLQLLFVFVVFTTGFFT